MTTLSPRFRTAVAAALACAMSAGVALAKQTSDDYAVGPQDVLVITSYDQPDLSGRFAVETDGTFTYPLIGRLRAGGRTLREVEAELKQRLIDQGFFRNPQVTVAIGTYRSQRIFILGEVQKPGAYALSGGMSLVEALALAGSTLPTSSGEVVIARAGGEETERVNIRDMENGSAPLVMLDAGDSIFVPRAESVYVFGQVRNPGAYPLPEETMLLQALSLAGGLTNRASTSRIQVVRMVGGRKYELRVGLTDMVEPGDTIVVPQRFF
jgi:polysaccharide export outer membrane protein